MVKNLQEIKKVVPLQPQMRNKSDAILLKIQKAKIAQLVERNLAKVEVAGSNPVFRSFFMPCHKGSDGGIGRHAGLKIQWAAMPVRVQVPLRVRAQSLSYR